MIRASADAGRVIVETAMNVNNLCKENQEAVIICADTDVLVLLNNLYTSDKEIFFKPEEGKKLFSSY